MKKLLLSTAVAFASLTAAASAETVAIVGGHIHTAGPSGEIESGTVVIRDGKIVSVGAGEHVPAGARVIDAHGAVVTPGLIAADAGLAATEVGEETTALVKHLKGLQDILGELHDAHVLSEELAAAQIESATERVRRLHEALYVEGAPEQEPKLPRDLRAGLLAIDRRVRDRIDCEYAQPLDVEALARDANMSAGHLSRQFKIAYGESPYSYLMTRRIERAMALLVRGDLSVTEICFEVGCSSLGTFSTRFTELVGVPPSTYRRIATGATVGMPSCVAKQVTRPIRNREARVTAPQLA